MSIQIDFSHETFDPGTIEHQASTQIPPYVDAYDTSHIPEAELRQIINSTDGDERLFGFTVGFYRFLHRELGPEEDPIELYGSYLSDVERRREELGITAHPVAQLDQFASIEVEPTNKR